MQMLSRLTNFLTLCVKCLSLGLLAALCLTIFVQVMFRYGLNSSLSWSEELARFMFIWIIMLGASTGVKEQYHVAIGAFIAWLPQGVCKVIRLFVEVLTLGVALFMLIYGVAMASNVIRQLSPAMRISMFWVYLSVPVSGGLMTLYLAESLLRRCFSHDAVAGGEL